MARLHRRSDICRRHPRPPRSQRPPHRSDRREPETSTLQIDPKGLTTDLQPVKNPASRVPASQATSSRIAGRHHLGISGRLRRNLHAQLQRTEPGVERAVPVTVAPSGALAVALVPPRADQPFDIGLPQQPSPVARPTPISLRSSGPLARFRLKSCNSTLADRPDGHLNYTAAHTL